MLGSPLGRACVLCGGPSVRKGTIRSGVLGKRIVVKHHSGVESPEPPSGSSISGSRANAPGRFSQCRLALSTGERQAAPPISRCGRGRRCHGSSGFGCVCKKQDRDASRNSCLASNSAMKKMSYMFRCLAKLSMVGERRIILAEGGPSRCYCSHTS